MSEFLRKGSLVCFLLSGLIAFSQSAFAQSTRGSLAGSVNDTSGAVIAGAKIVAVGVDTGVKNQTVSTSSGALSLSGAGHWPIRRDRERWRIQRSYGERRAGHHQLDDRR